MSIFKYVFYVELQYQVTEVDNCRVVGAKI